MFDAQVRRHRGAAALPEEVLASIAAYYRRVTTDARPMNRLVGAVMTVAVFGSLFQLIHAPSLSTLAAAALCCYPVGLAAARVVPAAARLGTRADPVEAQSAAARRIYRDHLVCLACIAAFVVLELLRSPV